MQFYNIHCFIVLAEELNFTKAAEIMNMTQSAFSKTISALEDEIGCRLFYRDRRHVAHGCGGRFPDPRREYNARVQ